MCQPISQLDHADPGDPVWIYEAVADDPTDLYTLVINSLGVGRCQDTLPRRTHQ